jgi:hypothetical protein
MPNFRNAGIARFLLEKLKLFHTALPLTWLFSYNALIFRRFQQTTAFGKDRQ